MTDKMYFISGDLFMMTNPAQKFVNWNEGLKTWVLDEQRWYTYCQELATRGVNMFRWLGWNVWFDWYDPTYTHNLTPFVQQANGLYDLSKRNDKYWELAERMIQIMNYPSQKSGNTAPGITLWIDLFYQYANDADDIRKSPWRNNVQGITNLYDVAARPYAEAYMKEWIGMGKKLHPITNNALKIVYGMGNEMGEDSLDFCYWMLDIMDREKVWPFSWAICPDVPSNEGNDLFKMLPKYIYDHNLFIWYPLRSSDRWDTSIIRPTHSCCNCTNDQGVNVFETAMGYWACLPIRWVASDDGCMGGSTPRPGEEEWYGMVYTICTYRGTDALTIPWDGIEYPPIMGVEHLPDDEPWDVCRTEQLKVFDSMAAPYRQYIGEWENAGKWPVEYTPQECKAGETQIEVCWDGSVITTYTCQDGKWVPTGNTCPPKPDQKCSCWYYINWNDTLFGLPNFIKCILGSKEPYCKDK